MDDLQKYIAALESARILKVNDHIIELSHDSIAEKIAGKRTPHELRIIECEKLIRIQYANAKKTKDFLSRKTLEYIAPVFDELNLTDGELGFYNESREYDTLLRRKENRREKRNNVLLGSFIFVLIAGLIATVMYSNDLNKQKKAMSQILDNLKGTRKSLQSSNASLEMNIKTLEDTREELMSKENSLRDLSNSLIDKNQQLSRTILENYRLINSLELTTDSLERTHTNLVATNSDLDAQRRKAQTLGYQTKAINYAYKSEYENNDTIANYRALQAYVLNDRYNDKDNKWEPEIINALLRTNDDFYRSEILDNDTSVLDMVKTGQSMIFINGSGNLYEVNDASPDAKKHLFSMASYYNQSLQFNGGDGLLTLEDMESNKFVLHRSDDSFVLKEKTPGEKGWQINLPNKGINILPNSFTISEHGLQPLSKNLPNGMMANCYALSPKNDLLAIGSNRGWLYLYNLSRHEEMVSFQYYASGGSISDIDFDGSGRFIATSSLDGTVKINEVEKVSDQQPVEIPHNDWALCVLFENSHSIYVGTRQGSIYKYNLDYDVLARNISESIKLRGNMHGSEKVDSLVYMYVKRVQQ